MADDENGDDEESFKKIVWEAQYVLSPACTLFEDSPLQLAFEHGGPKPPPLDGVERRPFEMLGCA